MRVAKLEMHYSARALLEARNVHRLLEYEHACVEFHLLTEFIH
jgi:hypothetical protein